MSMGGGSGTQTSTTQQSQHMPGWETPFAKAYLSALAGLVFPGMTIPSNYETKGYNFGNTPSPVVPGSPSASGGSPSGGTGPSTSGGGGATAATSGLDPQLQQLFANPMISGSADLQNWAQQNPGAFGGSMSPAAFNQLGQFYGSMMPQQQKGKA